MEVMRKLNLADLNQMVLLRVAIQNYDLKYIQQDECFLSETTLLEKTKSYIENHLDKNLFMFGLFVGDELVANCGFYFDEHFPTYNNPTGYCGYICNVFTKEEYRGRGFQKKLLKECMEYAKSRGITNFKLSTKNENAIKLYKSIGFMPMDNMYSYK